MTGHVITGGPGKHLMTLANRWRNWTMILTVLGWLQLDNRAEVKPLINLFRCSHVFWRGFNPIEFPVIVHSCIYWWLISDCYQWFLIIFLQWNIWKTRFTLKELVFVARFTLAIARNYCSQCAFCLSDQERYLVCNVAMRSAERCKIDIDCVHQKSIDDYLTRLKILWDDAPRLVLHFLLCSSYVI